MTESKRVVQLAAVVVARNEEAILGACLDSLIGLVDELILVDLESTDGTRAVAETRGARVISHAPVPYADKVRHLGIALTSADWVLLIDPDERVRPGLATEIRRLITSDAHDVVFLPYLNVVFGRELHSLGGTELAHPRLFRKGKLQWPTEIHTNPDLTGLRCHVIPVAAGGAHELAITHVPWRTPHQVLEKFSRYIHDDAQRRYAGGQRFSVGRMAYRLTREFGGRFVAGRTYEDGVEGLFYASLFTVYELGVQMELWQASGKAEASDRQIRRVGRLAGEPLRWVFPLWTRLRKRAKRAAGEVGP